MLFFSFQARAISFLDVFFGISEEGVDRVMHDLGVRAVCTLVSDGELHSELRRWLQDISRKARSRISRPFMSGLSKALALGSSEQRKAAITLLASLVGRWQQQHQVLTLLFQAAQTDPSESNRVVAVDSIAFLQEKHAKSDPTLAAAVAANCQRVLCALAARDNNAEVRCAAIDALNPMRSDEILLSDTAKLLCERLSDRSVKTRTKAALCLSSWGPERLEKTLTISDWKVRRRRKRKKKGKTQKKKPQIIKTLVKWGLAIFQPSKVRESIEPLVVSSLQGRNGLTLLRQLDLLKKNSPHEAFLRTHAAEIFPLILKNHAEATRNHHTVASGYDVGQVLLSDSDN